MCVTEIPWLLADSVSVEISLKTRGLLTVSLVNYRFGSQKI